MRALVLSITQEPHVRSFLTTGPGRRLAERFVAGNTLDDALTVTRQLVGGGMRVSLNYLGEAVHSMDEAEQAAAIYHQTLAALRESRQTATLALKPTQFGIDHDFARAVDLVAGVAAEAERLGMAIRLDMEGSNHTDAILNLWQEVFTRHRNVGIVLQASLYRTTTDLDRVLGLGGSVRLCKGAYAESSEIAYQDWREVRANFNHLLERLVQSAAATDVAGALPVAAIATHDEWLIDRGRDLAQCFGLSADRYEFQMLYGVRRDLQLQLTRAGEPLRIYVPWGPAWYNYLTRRLAERPSNVMFLGRAIVGEAIARVGSRTRQRENGHEHKSTELTKHRTE